MNETPQPVIARPEGPWQSILRLRQKMAALRLRLLRGVYPGHNRRALNNNIQDTTGGSLKAAGFGDGR